MKKISDFKVGDPVNFSFLGEHKTGVVLEVLPKENKLVVKTDRGIVHQVRSSEKESQFCYLI